MNDSLLQKSNGVEQRHKESESDVILDNSANSLSLNFTQNTSDVTGRLCKLSNKLNHLKDEASEIDKQIRELRKRRSELTLKISALESRINDQSDHQDLSAWESNSFPWSVELNKTLSKAFQLHEFRPLQLSAINLVLSGKDCLVIMSTGGGKSLCYQLPAVLKNGITLVVSPLVALIEDQIIQLKKLGIHAVTLNQHSTKEEIKLIHDALGDTSSTLRLLYVTPEKLAKSKRIMNRLEKCSSLGLLKLIAVDEVHCCSQWGHDFRPDYQFLNVFKRQFKDVPILGLTATATASVLDDVKSILGIQGATTLRATFNRENLYYEVRQKPASHKECLDELVSLLNDEFCNQTGIIYCFSRKECEELSRDLRKRGIKSAYYHAYVEPDARRHAHEQWLSGKYKVIVATLAFGMGIDKPDVRFVIHHSIAKSMENYYQESGRAGRDGKPAKCILYYKLADLFRQSTSVYTEKTGIQNLYSMLAYAVQNTECRRVCIAEHFDETWDASWCNKMCDNCNENRIEAIPKCNIADVVLIIRQVIIDQESNEKSRITGNKLMEILSKNHSLRKYNREALEEIIAKLIINGYLQEDFHFTPYSIISYVVVTERTRQLRDGAQVWISYSNSSKTVSLQKRKKIKMSGSESNPDEKQIAKKSKGEDIEIKC